MPSDRALINWLYGAQRHRGVVVFRLTGEHLRIHQEFVMLTLSLGRYFRARATRQPGGEQG